MTQMSADCSDPVHPRTSAFICEAEAWRDAQGAMGAICGPKLCGDRLAFSCLWCISWTSSLGPPSPAFPVSSSHPDRRNTFDGSRRVVKLTRPEIILLVVVTLALAVGVGLVASTVSPALAGTGSLRTPIPSCGEKSKRCWRESPAERYSIKQHSTRRWIPPGLR